ncbi:hypothetical protein HMPREF9209_0001, partial [Lactobacillus gasseri 224-1]
FGCIGGGIGGFLSSILNLKATGMSITVIPGILLFLNQQLPLYILVCVVGFGVAFGLTYVYYGKHAFDSNKNSKKEDIEKKQNTFKQEPSHVSDEVIDAPVSGKIEALNLVSDKAFAS